MIGNLLKVAFRNLSKRKGYTFINVAGLSVGIACCLFIAIYVFHEISFDTFLDNEERIYRIKQTSISPSKEEAGATTPFKAGPSLAAEYPQLIEHSVRFFDMQEDTRTIRYKAEDKKFREDNFYFTDSTFFEVFSPDVIKGERNSALAAPMTVVLTESTAEKYFGGENPIGKTLNFKGVADFTVTAIIEDWPRNSHMALDMLASMNSLDNIYNGQDYDSSWFWNPCWTYLLMKEGVSETELKDQFQPFVEKYYHAGLPEDEEVVLDLQPVTDIHLYSNLDQEMQSNNSVFYIYLFSAVAVLILLIACINFMNLSTARSTERAREVGMRKVLGADKRQLIRQFMGESFLMSFFGMVLAVILVHFFLPSFNGLVGKQFVFEPFQNGTVLLGLLGLWIIVGLLAGIYPSFFLASFRPSSILRGEVTGGSRGALFRKGLVVFQFSLSVILITGTILVYLQIGHMESKELGFEDERIVVLPIKQNLIAWEFSSFKEQALQDPSIISVTGISKILGSNKQTYYKYVPAGGGKEEAGSMMALYVMHDFTETFGIEIIAGRSFSREYPTDNEQAVLINESMLATLDVDTPEEALGKTFYYYPSDGERTSFSVMGVVNDFNYTSIKKSVDPVIIRMVEELRQVLGNIEYAAVKIAPGSSRQAIEHLKSVWGKVNHVDPFEYSFQEDELQKTYASETKMSRISGVFAALCILIACLGLFGLASFTSSKRTKEIGIRKTLGASISGILLLLSKDFVKLVLVANIVAWPVIYLLAVEWLQDFPSRISLGWNLVYIFGGAALLSIAICLVTVSYQSVRAALVNPADTLQQE